MGAWFEPYVRAVERELRRWWLTRPIELVRGSRIYMSPLMVVLVCLASLSLALRCFVIRKRTPDHERAREEALLRMERALFRREELVPTTQDL
jgi:hypothetical protein